MKYSLLFICFSLSTLYLNSQVEEKIDTLTDSPEGLFESILIKTDIENDQSFKYTIKENYLNSSNQIHFLDALKAKLPGADIYTASGRVGSSTRISLRGFSLSDYSKPLFIIDDIPYYDYISASYSLNGSYEFGNALNDINPFDIESVEIIPGAAGIVVYGPRAMNGVINIRTKQDVPGFHINFRSAYSFEKVLRLPQMQNVYGQGIFGDWVSYENTSFGPKLDDAERNWGNIVNDEQLEKAFSALPNNLYDFFETGHTWNNHLAISGGSKNYSVYVSYANAFRQGILPVNTDYYRRHNISVNLSASPVKNLKLSSHIKYIMKKGSTHKTGQGLNFYNNLLQQPRDIPITDMSDHTNEFFNIDNYYSTYTVNPYFVLNEHGNFNEQTDFFGNFRISYKLFEHFELSNIISYNKLNSEEKFYKPIFIPEGNNAFTYNDPGSIEENLFYFSDFNNKGNISFTKKFNDIFFKVNIGHNTNIRESHSNGVFVYGLTIPGYYDLSNSTNPPQVNEYLKQFRSLYTYADLLVSFRDLLILNPTLRRDRISSKPDQKGSYSYGINFMFNFSELILKNNFLNDARLRASYGKTANEIPPYMGSQSFYQPGRFPLMNGLNAMSLENFSANPDLGPVYKKGIEVGIDADFLNDFASFSFTYYHQFTEGLIFSAPASPSSGYSYSYLNSGKILNKGIEIYLVLNPVRKENIKWSISLNFFKNASELTELPAGQEEINLYGLLSNPEVWMKAKLNEPFGIFECSKAEIYIDDTGVEHIVVDANGVPIAHYEEYEYCGKAEHDFISGISNSFFFYGFRLDATVDIRKGGKMYSRTARQMYFTGNTPKTLYNDRQPFIIPNSVIQTGIDQNGDPVYSENVRPVTNQSLGGHLGAYWTTGGSDFGKSFIIDRSFIKLRELTLTYSLKRKWIEKIKLTAVDLFIFGNNLLLRTPYENNFIDPESSSFYPGISGKFGEYSEIPSYRSYGFGINIYL